MPRRILLVSASMGGGHDGVANELRRRLCDAGHEAQVVDFLAAPIGGAGWLMRGAYKTVLRRAPWVYEVLYRLLVLLPLLRRAVGLLVRVFAGRRVRQWVDGGGWDAVVSTYPLASQVLGHLRANGSLKIPVATFITDAAIHPLWLHPKVDHHFCIEPSAAGFVRARLGGGVSAPGPVVPLEFHGAGAARNATRLRLGLGRDARVVLIVAGSWGVGSVEETAAAVSATGRYTPVVVCGRNELLRARLAAQATTLAIGWTDDMPGLMAAADVLVQNAGGLTCNEAFAAGVPVISYRPLPGHGRDNALRLEAAGLAPVARTAAELEASLDQAFGMEGHRRAAAVGALFARDAADEVLELVGSPPSLVPAPRRARRRVAAVAVAMLLSFVVLTVGFPAAVVHAMPGLEHTRRTAAPVVYLATRLDSSQQLTPSLEAALVQTGCTVIVDGELARTQPTALRRLAASGVDIANAGWDGRRHLWHARPADVATSAALIRRVSGAKAGAYVPERRVRLLDLAQARFAEERLVQVGETVPAGGQVADLRRGGIYLLDERGASDQAVLATLAAWNQAVANQGLVAEPLAVWR